MNKKKNLNNLFFKDLNKIIEINNNITLGNAAYLPATWSLVLPTKTKNDTIKNWKIRTKIKNLKLFSSKKFFFFK